MLLSDKYKVLISLNGTIRRRLNGKLHCTTRPAVEHGHSFLYNCEVTEWWTHGEFKERKLNDKK